MLEFKRVLDRKLNEKIESQVASICMDETSHTLQKKKLKYLAIVFGLTIVAVFVLESCFFKFGEVLSLVVFCFWLFPIGLTGFFSVDLGESWTGLVAGWLVYLVVIIAALRTNKRSIYYILCAILCLMLLLSIAGCHKELIDFSKS